MHNQRFEEAAVDGDVAVEKGKGYGDDGAVCGGHFRCVGERDGVGWWCWGEREF